MANTSLKQAKVHVPWSCERQGDAPAITLLKKKTAIVAHPRITDIGTTDLSI